MFAINTRSIFLLQFCPHETQKDQVAKWEIVGPLFPTSNFSPPWPSSLFYDFPSLSLSFSHLSCPGCPEPLGIDLHEVTAFLVWGCWWQGRGVSVHPFLSWHCLGPRLQNSCERVKLWSESSWVFLLFHVSFRPEDSIWHRLTWHKLQIRLVWGTCSSRSASSVVQCIHQTSG